MQDKFDLTREITISARKALKELFSNGESYYYCSLLTSGEGLTPFISAWSIQQLEQCKKNKTLNENDINLIKWSYADSPFCAFGYQYFEPVTEILDARPCFYELSLENCEQELDYRLDAMENAMKTLDSEGLFALNQPREEILIEVGFTEPSRINTDITLRLNNPKSQIVKKWLLDVAE